MRRVTRREFLAGLAGLGGAGVLAACASPAAPPAPEQKPAAAAPAAAGPKEVKGFLTTANVEQAEKEGALVYYGGDPEHELIVMLQEFQKLFPKIDTSGYLREASGRMYARLTAERQAGKYFVDVLAHTDMGIALELIKTNATVPYLSPSLKDYDAQFKSNPPGHFTWYAVLLAGIAYNTKLVTDAEAPKGWKDLLDPKWKDAIIVKDTASGIQGVQWYSLRKLYGDKYWQDMAAQKPHIGASTTQQYERLVRGDDKINGLAHVAEYLQLAEKSAPVKFVAPPDGLVGTPWLLSIADKAPHPEAAKLFVDWLLSPLGQQMYVKLTSYYSVRKDVEPPKGGKPFGEMKVIPVDWAEFYSLRDDYVKAWNAISGIK